MVKFTPCFADMVPGYDRSDVKVYQDEDLMAIIDAAIQITDDNDDGWITYPEYFVRMTERPLRTIVLSDGQRIDF